MVAPQSGYVNVNNARLYYETAGNGIPIVMIHAGIADSRMWQNEFTAFQDTHQVLRYDMRGYGKSLPVEGEFNFQDDLSALLAALDIQRPLILMGCSIGAGLAMDFAWAAPQRVQSLILVGGAPADLELEAEWPQELFAQSEKAFENGDIDLVAEIDMKIWFDGFGRSAADVNPEIRQRAYDMAHLVTKQEIKQIGKHIRKTFDQSGVERLHDIKVPTLVVVGENDLPYVNAAADFMADHLPNATKLVIPNAAHLPNMERPQLFQAAIRQFLRDNC